MRRIPRVNEKVVARVYINLAFGLLDLNCFLGWKGGGLVPKSVALNIGPILPALLLRRFPMTV